MKAWMLLWSARLKPETVPEYFPSQEPMYDEPWPLTLYVPSYRAPIPRPFNHCAQSLRRSSATESLAPRFLKATYRHSTAPLASNGPLVVQCHLLTEAARRGEVFADAHLQLGVIEDLVVVGVEQERPHARPPVIPGVHALERIVEGDSDVGALQVTPTIHVELLEGGQVQAWPHGLIHQLDGSNCWMAGVIVADLVQRGVGLLDRIALGPVDGAPPTAVVEAVLG